MKDDRDIYPLTIVSDRYSGTYSGARFLAFNLYPFEIPEGIDEDDSTCMMFWNSEEPKNYHIGKGNTVQEAFDNLYKLLNP